MQQTNNDGFIPQHDVCRNLITYQKSKIIYDGTVYFTKRFFQKYNRTIDQINGAGCKVRQPKYSEASIVLGTSKETEIKLTM